MGIRIRQFAMDDYPDVYDLWKRSGLNMVPSDTAEEVQKKVARDPELFLVAEEGVAGIVGCVMGAWDGRRAWVYHMAVDPAHQRRGIGRRLMEELERRLVDMGAIKINLLVRKQNDKGRSFYHRLGYEVQDEFEVMTKRFFQIGEREEE